MDTIQDTLTPEIEEARDILAREFGPDPGIDRLIQWNQIIQYTMLRRAMTLATAESCTGGYIASQITEQPGSSGYFLGSVVSYANSVKQQVLGVSPDTLRQYGAVSSQCAMEMMKGVLEVIGSDVAIAVTGIAGPDGGSAEKPVGTVFVCLGNRDRQVSVRLNCDQSRTEIVHYTYKRCMAMLFGFLSQ